jgi:hypothetical protein
MPEESPVIGLNQINENILKNLLKSTCGEEGGLL